MYFQVQLVVHRFAPVIWVAFILTHLHPPDAMDAPGVHFPALAGFFVELVSFVQTAASTG